MTRARQSELLWWGLAVVAGLLLIGIVFTSQIAHWGGRKARVLAFSIVSADSDAPVAGARIAINRRLMEANDGEPESLSTSSSDAPLLVSADADGRVSAACEFDSYGHTSAFHDWGRVHFQNYSIRVTAPGYEPASIRLGEEIGPEADYHENSPIELRVKLKRLKANSQAPE